MSKEGKGNKEGKGITEREREEEEICIYMISNLCVNIFRGPREACNEKMGDKQHYSNREQAYNNQDFALIPHSPVIIFRARQDRFC